MTREEYLSQVRKGTGKVYQILANWTERYYTDKRSLMFWNNLNSDLIYAGTEASKESRMFPVSFYPDMVDALLRWHWDKFDGIRDIEIKPTFQILWQYHRKYLGQVQTDEMWTEAIKDGDEILKDADPHLKGFVMAILRDLEKRNPREVDNTHEPTAAPSTGKTV